MIYVYVFEHVISLDIPVSQTPEKYHRYPIYSAVSQRFYKMGRTLKKRTKKDTWIPIPQDINDIPKGFRTQLLLLGVAA